MNLGEIDALTNQKKKISNYSDATERGSSCLCRFSIFDQVDLRLRGEKPEDTRGQDEPLVGLHPVS